MPQIRTTVAAGVAFPSPLLEMLEPRRLLDGSAAFGSERSVSDQGSWDAMFASQIVESRAAESDAALETDSAGQASVNDDDIYAPIELWTAARSVAAAPGAVLSPATAVIGTPESAVAEHVETPAESSGPNDDDIYGVFEVASILPVAISPEASALAGVGWVLGSGDASDWIEATEAPSFSPLTPAELSATYTDLTELPELL